MSIVTEKTGERFENVVANIPLDNNYPLFSQDDVVVNYGKSGTLIAQLNEDYTVEIDESNYDKFKITPTAILLAKINALITADPTNETNYIVVRRVLDNITTVTSETARSTSFIAREFEKIAMRFQTVQEQLKRSLLLSPSYIGLLNIFIDTPVGNAFLKWSDDGSTIENGPTTTDIENVAANALTATNAASDALATYNNTVLVKNQAVDAAAEAQADADQVAEALDSLILGPNQPKSQIFTSGVANAATLTLSTTPYPTIEQQCDIIVYTTATGSNKGTLLPSDTYTYSDTLNRFSFSPSLPADATKVEIKWWTSLNIGAVPDKSVSWFSKIIDATANTIAGWDAAGEAVARAFVTTLAAATDLMVPTAKAVKDYVDNALATFVGTGPVKVYSYTPSGSPSSIVIPDIFRDGYNYRIIVDELACTTNGVALLAQFLSAGTTAITASNYGDSGSNTRDTTSTYNSTSQSGSAFMRLNHESISNADLAQSLSGEFTIFNPAKTGKIGYLMGVGMSRHPDSVNNMVGGYKTFGYKIAGTLARGIKLYWSAGNFRNQGRITIWEEPI